MKIIKYLVIILIANFSLFAFSQDEETTEPAEKDTEKTEISEAEKAWTEINELLVQRQNLKDEEFSKHSKLLLEKLQDFIKRDDIDIKHKNFAISIIANLMSELEMLSEFLEFSQKYIAESDIIEEIKTLLKESRIKVLFELEKYDELVKEADKYLAELPENVKLSGSQKLTKAFLILYKAKGLIMLAKPQEEQIKALNELSILHKNEKNPEILFKIKNIERMLKHFIVIHPGAELEDWSLKNTNGEDVKLSDSKGKFTLLVLWQSWLSPCKTMMNKYLKKMQTDYANLKILGVSNEDSKTQNEFIADNNITWECLVDAESKIYRKYSILNMPYVILLNDQQKVIFSGSFEVMKRVEKYLTDKFKVEKDTETPEEKE